MNGIKLNKGIIYNLIIIALIIYIVSIKQKEEAVVVPAQENEMFIDSPVEQPRLDTVWKDSVKKIEILKVVEVENPVNEDLLEKYQQAIKENDSLKQVALYMEAITERNYNEVFEDSIQTITVKSEIIGTLKRQSVHYITKPKTINIQPEAEKISLFAGGFAYGINEPAVGLNLNLVNREKNKIFMVGYDTQKRVHIGVTFKLY